MLDAILSKAFIMSETINLKENDFKLISYKRKNKQKLPAISVNNHILSPIEFNKTAQLSRIQLAKEDILASDFYASVRASLREALQILKQPDIKEILCLGLGKFGECMISRYQFALLLCLQELYQVKVNIYDPAFTCNEIQLIEEFGFNLLKDNCEGKFKACAETLFYLPHCPKQLTNNLLWANWGLNLSKCLIFANSFHKIIESNPKRILAESANFLYNISPYMLELAVINNFKYFDIFNDSALHIFPLEKLQFIAEDFWTDSNEPNYKTDLEFIRN